MTAARVTMTARPAGYLALGEIEVFAKAPGVSSDAAAAIEVAGVPIAGFDPRTTTCRVVTKDLNRSGVTAVASDPYAAVVVRKDNGLAVVTVTSEDGSRKRDYRIELVRR